METRRDARPAQGLTIKGYVALWAGSVLVSFVALVATWCLTQPQLRDMRQRIFAEARALDKGRVLMTALLTAGREDLLRQTTGEAAHAERKLAALREAEAVAGSLGTHAVLPVERQLAVDIGAAVRALHARAAAEPQKSLDAVRPDINELMATVSRYMQKNESDLEEAMQKSVRLRGIVNYTFFAAVAFAAVVVVGGSVGMVRRVLRPVLELTRAAKQFGRGDFATRACAARDDEMGGLCQTFNTMAGDLAAYEKTRLEFVATVAHDLKNPLITIGGAARRLRRGGLDAGRQATWLDAIVRETDRLEKLTHDLMDTVQVSTGRLTLNKAELDLTALVRELLADQADVFCRHVLTLEGEEDCRVLGDRDRLERVALNLLSNAIKYSPDGSTVLLRVVRAGGHALLRVQDQGAGMSPEDLHVLFLPFGRGALAHQVAKGTGLGMCVVKSIIEAHSGTITVHSQLGKGTTVDVILPLAGG